MQAEGQSLPEHLTYAEVMTRTGDASTRQAARPKNPLLAVDSVGRTNNLDLCDEAIRPKVSGVAVVDEDPITIRRETTAARIKKAREIRGLTQETLAGRVGTRRTYVIEWEGARHAPGARSLQKLSAVLGFPVYWFLIPPDEDDQ